ncbi:MAG: alpha/beta fold hydrolase [Candidatus Binatus sp.]|uniref:esterase/lipase family protein n=1 Tax=Candidatus Binatus sp. TaxID=2811406 RepID=UPI003C774E57
MAVGTFIYSAYRDYSSKRSALLLDPVFQGNGIPKGQGHAILLIPGFTAGDWTFNTMSPWLQQIGYRTHHSGISVNVGCPQRKVERMLGRLEEISKEAGGPIVIIGHSLGGLVGCALARQRPELVRHVIAIGSPLRSGWQAVTPEVRSALFAIHTFFQRFIETPQDCGTERCTCCFSKETHGAQLPPGVRFTSIYSRQDGIVDWRFAATENGDNYEVDGLHTDLVVNVEVYRILSYVLAGSPREIVKLRCMAAAAASDINGETAVTANPVRDVAASVNEVDSRPCERACLANGRRSVETSSDSPSGHSLGGIADERVGLFESGVMRRIALKLGIQTPGFGARRFLAAEHPSIGRSVTLDCDRGSGGLARIARES